MVVDESHHSEANTFKETIQYFEPRILLGMTATPDRMDGKDIRGIFGDELINLSLAQAPCFRIFDTSGIPLAK